MQTSQLIDVNKFKIDGSNRRDYKEKQYALLYSLPELCIDGIVFFFSYVRLEQCSISWTTHMCRIEIISVIKILLSYRSCIIKYTD